jgi:uncharacterized repeat protein (TIGR01451 family)
MAFTLAALATVGLMAFSGAALGAGYQPAFTALSLTAPTNFPPGDSSGVAKYDIRLINTGGAPSHGPVTITDTLPEGLSVHSVSLQLRSTSSKGFTEYAPEACEVNETGPAAVVSCELSSALVGSLEPEILQPMEERRLLIRVDTPSPPGGTLPLTNHVSVVGGGAEPVSRTSENEVNPEPAEAGFNFFKTAVSAPDGTPVTKAASHPFQLINSFAVNTAPGPPGATAFIPAGGNLKDLEFTLPNGFIANPTVTPRCTQQQFTTTHNVSVGTGERSTGFTVNDCPDESAIGVVMVQQAEGEASHVITPIYNLVPPPGMPAEFGFELVEVPFYITTEVSPEGEYRGVAKFQNLTEIKRVTAATTIIWGTPAEPVHDPVRGRCLNPAVTNFPIELEGCDRLEAEPPYQPFFRMPSSCSGPLFPTFAFDSWITPGSFLAAQDELPEIEECDQVPFEPTMVLKPDTETADSPAGLDVNLHIPQGEDSEATGQADLRKTVVQMPRGLVVNPSGANGLDACTPAQIGLRSAPGEAPAAFDGAPPHCPPAARIGTATVHTRLVDHPLEGNVYVASPYQNPFDSLLAIYLTVNDPATGVVVKLPGEVRADPQNGQLTATFDDTPQVPVEDFHLDFTGGPLAALRTPATCGDFSIHASLTPWSAPDSGPPAEIESPFSIVKAPGGGACAASEAALPHSPLFHAGSTHPVGGDFSPFVLILQRDDGTQEFSSVDVRTPRGLAAQLKGVPYCPEAALSAAGGRTGAAELGSPSCPSASLVGRVIAGAGAGPSPYFTEGKVYLAGPYKGAPLSLAVVTPVVAGPYDLGNVLARTALYVDPETGLVRAVSDPIPSILQGIPTDVRSLTIMLDRPSFSVNPTSCAELAVAGQVTSTVGQVASVSARYQLEGCKRLRFKPKMSFSLRGGMRRAQNPRIRIVLTNPAGQNAGLEGMRVTLPHSVFLDNEHFQTICTRVQFAASECPKGAIYGHARAFTPLLEDPLEGPVYLRSSSHPLPDLVVDLNGQLHIVGVGRIDSVKGRMRTTLEGLPDAPVSKVVVDLAGGKRGILENSANLCQHVRRAAVRFSAYNGKTSSSQPIMKPQCDNGKERRAGR